MQFYAGIDIGSTTGKAALIDENNIICATHIIAATERPEKSAQICFSELLRKAGIDVGEIAHTIGTGYGRVLIPFANDNISEITCHARGAKFLCPTIRTVIDIGGQDCKVISVKEDGRVRTFAMNDKCAAGTGRFMDSQARALGVGIEEFSSLAASATAPARISSQCSVFAESEIIALVNCGTNASDIVAGIHSAIASRLISLLRRIPVAPDITVTGGCAKNDGLLAALQKASGLTIAKLKCDPQMVGAIGAAVLAKERAELKRQKAEQNAAPLPPRSEATDCSNA